MKNETKELLKDVGRAIFDAGSNLVEERLHKRHEEFKEKKEQAEADERADRAVAKMKNAWASLDYETALAHPTTKAAWKAIQDAHKEGNDDG